MDSLTWRRLAAIVVALSIGHDKNTGLRIAIALVALAVIVGAVVVSKRRESVLQD